MPRTPVVMPKMSMTMTEGEVVEISVSVGQSISQGDVVAVVGTDKTDMEVESDFSGTVIEIVAAPGQVLEVGAPLLILETEGEDLLAGMFGGDELQVAEEAVVPTPVIQEEKVSPTVASEANQRILAMPGARKLAAEQGIDLSSIKPKSPIGVIKFSDLPVGETRVEKARVQIATVVETALQVPQFSISGELKLKHPLPKKPEDRFIPLARAWVRTLALHPRLNQHFQDGAFSQGNIRIAALVKSELGFVSPCFTVEDIASDNWVATVKSVLVSARENRIPLENIGGATTSITDLGEFGIKQANTLLFPPQTTGFNIGVVREKKNKYRVDFTLVVDHRIADPGDAALAIKTFEKELNEVLGGNS